MRLKNSIITGLVCGLGFSVQPVMAHHGVAGLGAAGLEGPGAPVESSNSATLPKGLSLLYFKMDHAEYERFDSDPSNPESDFATYSMLGIGHGFSSWFSGYAFLPYHHKVDEDGGLDSSGFADMSLLGQVGFKYDEGLKLTPENESLDDLEDWHFTTYLGFTLPTGDADLRLSDGSIDPGKSTGFGKSSYAFGMTATKQINDRLTFNTEVSHIGFQEYTYDDGNRVKFGGEDRLNLGLAYRLHTNPDRKLRVDLSGELQYLKLGRDVENGVGALATGGKMLYAVPGVRFYKDDISAAFGIKVPVSTDLNEEADQQGGEGTEDYRLIFSLSKTF